MCAGIWGPGPCSCLQLICPALQDPAAQADSLRRWPRVAGAAPCDHQALGHLRGPAAFLATPKPGRALPAPGTQRGILPEQLRVRVSGPHPLLRVSASAARPPVARPRPHELAVPPLVTKGPGLVCIPESTRPGCSMTTCDVQG